MKIGGITDSQWRAMLKNFTKEDSCYAIPDYVWTERLMLHDMPINKYRGEHYFKANVDITNNGCRVLRGSRNVIVHKSYLDEVLKSLSTDILSLVSQNNAILFEYGDITKYKARAKERQAKYREYKQKQIEERIKNDPEFAAFYQRAEAKRMWIEKTQKENLKKSTESERILFNRTLKKFGKRVKKQYQITINGHIYFLDFYIKSMRIAIEVDGGYHMTIEQLVKDRERDANLASVGIKTIRIKNEQVTNGQFCKELLKILNSRRKRHGRRVDDSTDTMFIGENS